MSAYLKIPGIQGSVSSQGYEGWIELHDVEFSGIHQVVSMVVGQATDRHQDVPSFGKISMMKTLDEASIALFEATHSGQVFPQVEIAYVSPGTSVSTYAKMVLRQAMLIHYSDSYQSSSRRPLESLHWAYSQLERTYIPHTAEGRSTSPLITGFNLETATKL